MWEANQGVSWKISWQRTWGYWTPSSSYLKLDKKTNICPQNSGSSPSKNWGSFCFILHSTHSTGYVYNQSIFLRKKKKVSILSCWWRLKDKERAIEKKKLWWDIWGSNKKVKERKDYAKHQKVIFCKSVLISKTKRSPRWVQGIYTRSFDLRIAANRERRRWIWRIRRRRWIRRIRRRKWIRSRSKFRSRWGLKWKYTWGREKQRNNSRRK